MVPHARPDPSTRPSPALHALGSSEERARILDHYDVARPTPNGRPWVLANMVAGLDGSAATGGRVAELSGPTDRDLFRRLRTLADVVLVGASTIRIESYGAFVLTDDEQRRRVDRGQDPVPTLAVVSRSLDIDWTLPCFARPDGGTRPTVFSCESAPAGARAAAEQVADVVIAGESGVDLGSALTELGDRSATIVLTEGGPTLLAQLMADDLLDELCLTLAPVIGGDADLPIALPNSALPNSALPNSALPNSALPGQGLMSYDLRHVLSADSTLFLRYARSRSTSV